MSKLVGLVGWRGMVGSVLMDRMTAEGDFAHIDPVFFSTSNAGGAAPAQAQSQRTLQDANDVAALARCDIVLTCQGGDYTKAVYPRLRASGWRGHWIDAASALRMEPEAVIVLDPVNEGLIRQRLAACGRDWIGGNCTNSILLMGLCGLFRADLVEWENRLKINYLITDVATGERMTRGSSVQVAVEIATREMLLASPRVFVEAVERVLA